jgi:hypothetical protein
MKRLAALLAFVLAAPAGVAAMVTDNPAEAVAAR